MSAGLRQLIADTQETFRTSPEKACATFKSSSNLTQGFRSEVSIRDHRLTVDEPAALGGTDSGPNPVELVLAALGTCQEITYRAYATAMGIPLESVSVELEGDIDLRGFFAVDESVRSGYKNIRANVRIKSDASDADLQKLREIVNAHCPVLDIISNKVPVQMEMSVTRPLASREM